MTDQRPTRIILSGGGTSGHVNPALAIGRAFEARLGRVEALYVGVRGRAEEVIVPKAGLPLKFIPSAPYAPPGRPLAFGRFALTLGFGCLRAVALIRRFKPDFILATGGFASAPIVLAQAVLKRLGLSPAQTILHEANAVPGKLNQLMADRVDHLFLTFGHAPARHNQRRGVVVGYPVRQVLEKLPRAEARLRLGLDLPEGTKVVLVFGGSQGARALNQATVLALGRLVAADKKIFILHGVGLGGPDHRPQAETERLLAQTHGPDWAIRLAGLYRREIYLHDMAAAYSAADLVVCRAGAGAIHEISTLGRPALLVPKPNLPGDHQVQNARSLAGQGGAEILYEDLLLAQGRLTTGLDPDQLARRILELLDDPDRLAALAGRAREFMDPEAAGRIADLVLGRSDPGESRPPSRLLPPPPTHEGLLRLLGQAQQANPAAYDLSRLIPDHEELAYYRHRSALLLVHPDWNLRNVGVKLAGLLQDATKVDHLLLLLADRTPVKAWKRLLGGDFEQVGFIRRNVLTSLVLINRSSPEVEAGLMAALDDPYFEVRSAAAQAVAHFGDRLADRAAFEAKLVARLRDKSFEVVREAALALGWVGRGEEAVAALLGLRLNHYWQVRQAALKALRRLTLAGRVADPERLLQEITGFVVIATDFRPSFTIKESYQELVEAVRQAGQDQARPSGRSGEGA